MSCYSRETIEKSDYNNICKNHSARSERAELYRICPSKLSKRELEDLYFSLLENNLELKRTINEQEDKIKGLSVKVQRMSAAQKILQGKEGKECCIGTKAIVTEQNESITDLKNINQRLAEKVRQLNMRLCSAKQFFKRSPPVSTSRCMRCTAPNTSTTANTATTPYKCNGLDSANDPDLKLSSSSPNVDKETVSETKSAQTEFEKMNADTPCDENKCKTVMEELKQKIHDLQQELCHVHDEYSNRISRLESEVCEVRVENVRMSGERASSQHELALTSQKTNELMASCRTSEGKCAELLMQLSIERRKVAELETQLKAANISERVNETIEDHLTNIHETNGTNTHKSKIPTRKSKNTDQNNMSPRESSKLACTCPRTSKEDSPIKIKKNSICACPNTQQPESNISEQTPLTEAETSSKGVKELDEDFLMNGSHDVKIVMCGCPVPQHVDTVVNSTATKKSNKVICGCQPADTRAPVKGRKNIKCGCPPWQDSELDKSTPTKDLQCVNCTSDKQKTRESFQSTPKKSGTHPFRSSKDNNMSWSPKMSPDNGNVFRTPDDSGYTDTRSHDTSDEKEGLNKVNMELMKQIVELQSQVDSMKIAGASEIPAPAQRKLSHPTETSHTGATPRNSTDKSVTGKFGNKLISHHQSRKQNVTPTNGNHRPEKMELESDKPKTRTSVDHGAKKPEIWSGEQNVPVIPMPRTSLDQGTKKEILPSGEQMLSMSEDQEYNRTFPQRKLELIPDQITTVSENNVGQLSETAYHKLSKPEKIIGSPNSADDDNRHTDTVEMVPGNQQTSPTEERRPSLSGREVQTNEYLGPNKTEIVSDNLKYQTAEERNQSIKDEYNSGRQEINGTESIPSTSRFGYANPDTPSHDYQQPKKTEAVPGKLEILNAEGIIGPELLYGARESETKDYCHRSDKPEIVSGQSPNDVQNMVQPGKWPTTENLAQKVMEIEHPVEENCQYCPACSYETECAAQHKVASTSELKSPELGTKTAQAIKNDQHNSYQIPGPIPTGEVGKGWKKNVFKHFEKKKHTQKHKDKTKQKKESFNRDTPIVMPRNYIENSTMTNKVDLPDVPLLQRDKKPSMDPPPLSWEYSRNNLLTLSKESFRAHHRTSADQGTATRDSYDSHDTGPANHSLQNYYVHSDDMIHTTTTKKNNGREHSMQVEQRTDQKPQEQTVEITPAAVEPQVVPAQRIQARKDSAQIVQGQEVPLAQTVQAEAVQAQMVPTQNERGIQVQGQEQPPPNNQQRKNSTSEQGTYTVDSNSKQCRSTSPDNTEMEISYMSDLPLEKDAKHLAGSRALSPGEEKMVTAQTTESSTSPMTTNFSLSEGELPLTTTRRVSYDNSRKGRRDSGFSTPAAIESAQKMEAALQAISDELARCKMLLKAQRPPEVTPFYRVK